MIENLSTEVYLVKNEGEKEQLLHSTAIFMMADSGARGSAAQIRQLSRYEWSNGETFW
jgi:DNA-directed RNA polymerase beta' subunit